MMKTHVMRFVWPVVLAAFLGYVIRLYMNQAVLVRPMFSAYNLAAYIGLLVILVFLLVASFRPQILPDNRWTIAVFGLALILCADVYLMDSAQLNIYTSDFTKLLGVLLVFIGPMKWLVPPAVREERAQKNVEIIEV